MTDSTNDSARRFGPALEATYQFILWLVPAVEKFPRSQKFLLGDRVQATALEMLLPWRLWRGGGFGPAILPEGGGSLDQSALMLDALTFMDRVVRKFESPKAADR